MTKFSAFFNDCMQPAIERKGLGNLLTCYNCIDSLGGLVKGLNIVAVENTDEIELFFLNSPDLISMYPYIGEIALGKSICIGNVMIHNYMTSDLEGIDSLNRNNGFINIIFVSRNPTKNIPTANDIKYTLRWSQMADVIIIPSIHIKKGIIFKFMVDTVKYKDSTLLKPDLMNVQDFYQV